jgi:capsular polysaccharide biosynthesis protein
MRNLFGLPLRRLRIYAAPFERPADSFKLSPQASCVGPKWIGLERNLTVIEETIPFWIPTSKDYRSLLWQYFRGPTVAIDQNVCVLIDHLNTKPNYFHWFLDALPRIFAAEVYQRLSGEPFSALVPEGLQSWQSDSLLFLGIHPEQWIQVPTTSSIRSWSFERLVSTFSHRHIRHSETGHFDALSPHAVAMLSSRLIAGMERHKKATPDTTCRRLYISRGKATQRRVRNEDAVLAFLSLHGFQGVQLDGLPLHQQIQLFQGATHIISAHGGALTNLLYISPGCQVLEIFQSGHGLRPDFFQLTALRGGLYSFSEATSLNLNHDIEIPFAVLRTFLEASL